MGNVAGGNKGDLRKRELREFMRTTHFEQQEIKTLFDQFKNLSANKLSEAISKAQFQKALGLKDSIITERIFKVFDINGDGQIDFREFICGLSIFSAGTVEEKLAFSFRIYDFDGDGFIDKAELYEMLKASLVDNYMNDLGEEQMKALVEKTFMEADTNNDGKISFDEYKEMVKKYPQILENFTISKENVFANGS